MFACLLINQEKKVNAFEPIKGIPNAINVKTPGITIKKYILTSQVTEET